MEAPAYEDLHALGLLVCILAGAIALMTLTVLGLDAGINAMIPGALAGGTDLAQIHGLQVIRHSVDTLLALTFIFNVVLFCIWLHHAVRNHLALGATHQEYSPGWAVGYFFVPVINIVLPYFVMREAWRTSHHLAGAGVARSATVLAWWGLYIGSGMVLWVAGQVLGGHVHDLRRVLHANDVEMVGFTLRLVSMALFIQMVRTITRLQRQRAMASPAAASTQDPTAELTA